MKLSDIFDAVDLRWGRGHEFQASAWKKGIRQTVEDFGQGFAVFVGSKLGAFVGDEGSARTVARNMLGEGVKREDIRIRRVKV